MKKKSADESNLMIGKINNRSGNFFYKLRYGTDSLVNIPSGSEVDVRLGNQGRGSIILKPRFTLKDTQI